MTKKKPGQIRFKIVLTGGIEARARTFIERRTGHSQFVLTGGIEAVGCVARGARIRLVSRPVVALDDHSPGGVDHVEIADGVAVRFQGVLVGRGREVADGQVELRGDTCREIRGEAVPLHVAAFEKSRVDGGLQLVRLRLREGPVRAS